MQAGLLNVKITIVLYNNMLIPNLHQLNLQCWMLNWDFATSLFLPGFDLSLIEFWSYPKN